MQWIFASRIYSDVPYEIIHRTNNNQTYKMPSKYYNRVYACTEDLRQYNKANDSSPIQGFICKEFSDFEFADEYLCLKTKNNSNIRHALIPICKWSPKCIDKFLLDIYLKKIFWIGKHSIRRE